MMWRVGGPSARDFRRPSPSPRPMYPSRIPSSRKPLLTVVIAALIGVALLNQARAQATAGLNIPARQTFLLGEYADYGYRASLDNRGRRDVTVRLRDKDTKAVAKEVFLPAGEKAKLKVSPEQEVAIENDTDGKAELFVRMSRGVQGMRYVNLDGTELSGRAEAPSTERRYVLDPSAGAPEERVTVSLAPGQRLVVGEGTSADYAVEIRTRGRDIIVSARDRESLEQTQSFGLNGRETINIRPHEVLYLDAGVRGAKLKLRFSEPVSGARVVTVLATSE